MSRLKVTALPLDGLQLVTRARIGDSRGFLSRLFSAEDLTEAGWRKPVAQVNHTYTATMGTVRGMHFQNPPHAEMKLVSCIRGEAWDVAVDLRPGSPTFLKWHAETLSPENGRAVLIPEGFAHGFQALTNDCELLYLHSAAYAAGFEGGVRHDDPRLGITWPRPVTEVSMRDRNHPLIGADYPGIRGT